MKNRSTLNSSAGFSLVELMVVVAIIGILAAMSVGQIQKQIAKSRQSEAKTGLATIYTAEKSFHSEWQNYVSDFGNISAGFEGKLRYNIGFNAVTNAAGVIGAGYTGSAATGVFHSAGFCAGAGAAVCQIIPSNGNTPAGALAAPAAVSATAFVVGATAQIYQAGTIDYWNITQNKVLTNSTPGIP